MKKKVLVSLTSLGNADWDGKIAELKKFGIAEFALFVTTLKTAESRQEIYNKIIVQYPEAEIPFCHIRPDMPTTELDFLVEKFGTRYFNIHTTAEFPIIDDYTKYLDRILIENSGPAIRIGLTENDLAGFAGICLDVSHLETARKQEFPGYKITRLTLEKIPVIANHVSAISDTLNNYSFIKNHMSYDKHDFTALSEFDYLKNYPEKYFGQFVAIEVVNSIEEQLKAKEYIESIIADKL